MIRASLFAAAALLAASAVFGAEGNTHPDGNGVKFVRFEGGRDMEVASVKEDGHWITFTLAGGGELSVPRERVQKTGDAVKEGAFFIVGKMTQSRGPEAAPSSSGPSPSAGFQAVPGASLNAPSCGIPLTAEQRAALIGAQEAEAKRLSSEVPESPLLFKLSAPAKAALDEEFNVAVSVSDARLVGALGFRLIFDSRALEIKAASDAGFYSGPLATNVAPLGSDISALIVQGSRMPGGATGERTVLNVRFRAFLPGETALTLSVPYAHNGDGASLPVGANDAVVVEVTAR